MSDLLESRRGSAAVLAAIVIVFLALRVTLLIVRDPFFDELFTLWIVRKPFAGILEALRHDSGPPLFYFVVHALVLRSVIAVRAFSLAASTATLAMILAARPLGNARFLAAALLAVYPPAVLLSIDARSYALCALFLVAGLVAICSDRPLLAAVAFVAAAYSHDYGALFFPLLLVPAGRTVVTTLSRRAAAFATAAVLFAPGVWLALHQPHGAMQWLNSSRWSWAMNLSFAGDYAYGLFAPAPEWLILVASLLLLVTLAAPLVHGMRRRMSVANGGADGSVRATDSRDSRPRAAFWAAASLVPLVLAVLPGAYFPMRFGAVIAVPLTLWIAVSLDSWGGAFRRVLIGAFLLIGVFTVYQGIIDHARRPIDSYRAAAAWTAAHVRPSDTVVASGYCYLEAAASVDARLIAMPAEQAVHPGWRAFPTALTTAPAGPFVWIGERGAPELSILRNTRSIKPLYANDRAIVAAVR